MKKIFLLLLFFCASTFAQDDTELRKVVITTNDSLAGKEIENIPFAVIEEVPLFPNCENVDKNMRMNCFNSQMAEHIKKNFSYPAEAMNQQVQGRVYVNFTIDKEGNIKDIVTRGHSLLVGEARRIIELLPQMTPGKQKGKTVNVRYTLPISFRLTE